MHRVLIFMALATLVSTAGYCQPASNAQSSPYAGQHKRAIKALSHDEVRGYLEGAGLGFSKAAELNHYPGPLHVLELAAALDLSPQQVRETRKLLASVKRETGALGEKLVDRERELDSLFASSQADPATSDALVAKIADLRGRIRAAHLRAHIAQRKILTNKQIHDYDKARGYTGSSPQKHKHLH